MTYTDLLNFAGMMLSIDGWVLAAYMFLAALIAAAMGLKTVPGESFFIWFLGIILAFFGPAYSDTVLQARFPYVFIFCFGVVGIGFAMAGFIAVCFAPSIFAFLHKVPARRWFLAANLAMVFPFGPVILFYFVFRDYKKSLATKDGAVIQPKSITEPSLSAPAADYVDNIADGSKSEPEPASEPVQAPTEPELAGAPEQSPDEPKPAAEAEHSPIETEPASETEQAPPEPEQASETEQAPPEPEQAAEPEQSLTEPEQTAEPEHSANENQPGEPEKSTDGDDKCK